MNGYMPYDEPDDYDPIPAAEREWDAINQAMVDATDPRTHGTGPAIALEGSSGHLEGSPGMREVVRS